MNELPCSMDELPCSTQYFEANTLRIIWYCVPSVVTMELPYMSVERRELTASGAINSYRDTVVTNGDGTSASGAIKSYRDTVVTNEAGTSVPISTVFGRLRDMLTRNGGSNFAPRRGESPICRPPPVTTRLPHMSDESLGLTGSGVTNSSDDRVVTRADRTTVPISTVFGRFKDMPVSSAEADFMAHTMMICVVAHVVDLIFLSTIGHTALTSDYRFFPSNANVPTNGAISLNSSVAVNIEVVGADPSPCVEFSPAYMDLDNEVNNEMRHFGGLDAPRLNPEIVEGLIHVLDEHNGLVRLFRTTRDRCNACDIPGFKIRLYNVGGIRGYELPTSDVLGAIVFEDGPRSQTDFDVIIEFRGGPPKRISKLHQSYMLQIKSKRLFQQYVVTVFCAIEQSRLDFIRKLQEDLRSYYLSCLYDAISRGERWGIMVGSIILLPSTFTGGLTPADRADIVCRVFQQKVKDFVKFLKEVKTFGRVAAVLYTIEFQKRGLPHCHTLLCVGSKNKITDVSQIDEYIFAELPDPVYNTPCFRVIDVVNKFTMYLLYCTRLP
nr:helitron helicase-like domain-containing protein [Tanacetum cinerariifolium]